MKERLGILISGSGTTMAEIIRACNSGFVRMDVACVVSSNANAYGLKRARFLGINQDDIICLNPKLPDFPEKLLSNLQSRGVTVVTQNGWLPKTPENVIEAYKDVIFNQHPGPLPEFGGKGMYGVRVHHAVLLFYRLSAREKSVTEVVAHRVEKEFDTGFVVKKSALGILPNDSPESLQQRALPLEYKLQIELLKDVVKGAVGEYPPTQPWTKTSAQKRLLSFCKQAAIATYPNGKST